MQGVTKQFFDKEIPHNLNNGNSIDTKSPMILCLICSGIDLGKYNTF